MQLIDKLREECLSRGVNGIKALGALFRGLDKDFSKRLSFHEFSTGMHQFGIHFTDEEIKTLFHEFDRDNNMMIDFGEFLFKLRPQMAQCRLDVIEEAFRKLDVIKDGFLKVEDMKGKATNDYKCMLSSLRGFKAVLGNGLLRIESFSEVTAMFYLSH